MMADANVTMVLYGEKGDTGERKLDTSAVRLCIGIISLLLYRL